MKTFDSLIQWTPRVICIIAILFISMFALDSFEPELSIWQKIGGFLIHLIPTYILIVMLIVAWKWEFVGGVIFTTLGLITSPIIFMHNYRMNGSVGMSLLIILMINFPFIVVGILFMWSHYRKNRSLRIS